MPLVQNGEFDEIGDVLILELQPTSAITSITGFTDGVGGASADIYFTKTFRYSTTGTYSGAWLTLDDPTLIAITTNDTLSYWFQIRYARAGTDPSGVLLWNFFNLNLITNPLGCPTLYGTIFKTHSVYDDITTCDTTWAKLWGNLCDKMMKYGIIPEYVKRTEDFEHYYCTIVKFLSLNFVFATQFGNIYDTENTLRQFLIERGVFLCGDETLMELQAITNQYYEGMRQRGTLQVKPELKRLLCAQDCDMYLLEQASPFETGFTIDKASPCYLGAQAIKDFNMMTEKTQDVVDLTNYYLLNSSAIGTQSTTDNNGDPVDVMFFNNVFPTTGIGMSVLGNIDPYVYPNLVVVDETFNFELSFYIRGDMGSIGLLAGVTTWDCDGNKLDNQHITNGANSNLMLLNQPLPDPSLFYQVRGMIYGSNTQTVIGGNADIDFATNLGYGGGTGTGGWNLRLPPDAHYVYPLINIFDPTGTNNVEIYGVRIALSSHQTQYATLDPNQQVLPALNTGYPSRNYAFINSANFLFGMWSYNNTTLTTTEVDAKIEKYLIPMNCNLQTVTL